MTDVYGLFLEEVDALTIGANDLAVHVVGLLTRAAKRAQMVHDGELPTVERRISLKGQASGDG